MQLEPSRVLRSAVDNRDVRRLVASRVERPVQVERWLADRVEEEPGGADGKGDTRRRWVATEDVAALVAAVTSEPDPPELIEFGGPEALSRNEAVVVAEQACGRSFKVRRVPLPVARVGMRLARRRNDALASVFGTGVLQDLAPGDWDDAPLRDRGITPRPASDWIIQQTTAAQ